MEESIYDIITNKFTSKMKKMKTHEVYNLFSNQMSVKNTTEAKEIFAFIRKLQETNDYLLKIAQSNSGDRRR